MPWWTGNIIFPILVEICWFNANFFCLYRDLVHRQTSCAAIKHMSLGVHGFGCEDALVHLMNFVWPNVFETSPHLVQAFMDAVDGMRVSLGPVKVLSYVLQVRLETWKKNDSNFFLFCFRVSSIQLEKFEMFTGKFTTQVTLAVKTH